MSQQTEPTRPEASGDGAAPLRGRAREARDNDRILMQAAREVFSRRGWQAPMSAVAEHAGIGIASIYRRFPSKDDLVLHLRTLAISDITDVARASLAGEGSAVARFLRRHISEAASPLMVGSWRQAVSSPEIDRLADELHAGLDALVAQDAAAGLIPNAYTAADLMLAVAHLRPNLPAARERTTEIHLRHVDLYLLGLTASVTHPELVSGTGSTWDEWLSFNVAEADAAGSPGAS